MNQIFFVIPAYNESFVISSVVRAVQKLCSNIIVVDDGSDDDTFSEAKSAGAEVLRHIVNRGQGAALATGVLYSLSKGAEIIVTFDADGQHDPSQINELIEPILQKKSGCSVRVPIPCLPAGRLDSFLKIKHFHSAIPFSRLLTLKLALLHQWFFTGLKVTDTHCGLRAFSRKAAEKITITQDRMAHASEILEEIARHRLSFIEVPVRVRYTAYSLEKGQRSLTGSIRILYDFFVGRFLNVKR